MSMFYFNPATGNYYRVLGLNADGPTAVVRCVTKLKSVYTTTVPLSRMRDEWEPRKAAEVPRYL